ncbi:MAG: S-layer homology domain-containing protein [Actinobacteria bacterium]|nr:S-layer homology domain-containing protein [Actinomycetota bacterium]MCG2801773.1 S-layer homology domain-containing protein [Cellulomonas sp.]
MIHTRMLNRYARVVPVTLVSAALVVVGAGASHADSLDVSLRQHCVTPSGLTQVTIGYGPGVTDADYLEVVIDSQIVMDGPAVQVQALMAELPLSELSSGLNSPAAAGSVVEVALFPDEVSPDPLAVASVTVGTCGDPAGLISATATGTTAVITVDNSGGAQQLNVQNVLVNDAYSGASAAVPAHTTATINVTVARAVNTVTLGIGNFAPLTYYTVSVAPLLWDVDLASPFLGDVQWLVDQGITKPGADGKYGPAGPVQRAAMAAFLYRSAGSPVYTAPTASPFTDVATADAFYKEMCWLADQGITKPGADGKFGPSGTVSREAMSAFLYRFAGSPAFTAPTTSPFADVSTDATFYQEMAWLSDEAITKPGADHKFGPTGSVSREAMAAFLHRASTAGVLGKPVG